jgi:hypothetical protein
MRIWPPSARSQSLEATTTAVPIVVLGADGCARVHAHPDAQGPVVLPLAELRGHALDLLAVQEGLTRPGEDEHEAIAHVLHLHTPEGDQWPTQDVEMRPAKLLERHVAQALEQFRGALEVGEDDRDSVGLHGSPQCRDPSE